MANGIGHTRHRTRQAPAGTFASKVAQFMNNALYGVIKLSDLISRSPNPFAHLRGLAEADANPSSSVVVSFSHVFSTNV